MTSQCILAGRLSWYSVNTGSFLVCSVDVDDFCFDTGFFAVLSQDGQLSGRFDDFVRQWEGVCKVLPEFKVAVADIETFLWDLRRWLEQVELGFALRPHLMVPGKSEASLTS